jgi:type IV secretory pathway TrbL component
MPEYGNPHPKKKSAWEAAKKFLFGREALEEAAKRSSKRKSNATKPASDAAMRRLKKAAQETADKVKADAAGYKELGRK